MAERRSAEEIREALEGLNVGRLRVATKGIDRSKGAGSPLVTGERRIPGDPRPLHAGASRRSADPDDDDRRAPPTSSVPGVPSYSSANRTRMSNPSRRN